MNVFTQLYHRNKGLFITFIIAAAVGCLSFFNRTDRDPLAEYKKQVKSDIPADARAALDRTIGYISRNDMDNLYKMMAHRDRLSFQENYVKGLFSAPDFCPVAVSEDSSVRIAKSSKDHVIVTVYSKKRKCEYAVSRVKVRGTYKIYSIFPKTLES